MTATAITTLNPTPSPSPKPQVKVSSPYPAIPSVENVPNTPVPLHIKQMRFLLVFTLFFSAYAIYASILLTKLTFNFIPTVALATWTLVMLFPLELDHHEGVAQSERHLLKWIVDQRIVLNSQRTAGAWGVSACRTVFFALMGMAKEDKAQFGMDVWVLAALEAASAGSLYVLASRWAAENWKHTQDKELEKQELENEKKVQTKKAVKASS